MKLAFGASNGGCQRWFRMGVQHEKHSTISMKWSLEMTAYVVFTVKSVHDQQAMDKYRQLLLPLIESQNLKMLAGPSIHTELEGGPFMAGVVIEFEDVDAARDWYHSKDYQRALAIRTQASESYGFILEAWPAHAAA